MVRLAELSADGYSLVDAEQRHAEAPDTFYLPPMMERNSLSPGDFVKLIFDISVSNDGRVDVERMWVIVQHKIAEQYLGILDNDPYCIDENDRLWSGVQVAFEPKHVIEIRPGDSNSRRLADHTPTRPWR